MVEKQKIENFFQFYSVIILSAQSYQIQYLLQLLLNQSFTHTHVIHLHFLFETNIATNIALQWDLISMEIQIQMRKSVLSDSRCLGKMDRKQSSFTCTYKGYKLEESIKCSQFFFSISSEILLLQIFLKYLPPILRLYCPPCFWILVQFLKNNTIITQ